MPSWTRPLTEKERKALAVNAKNPFTWRSALGMAGFFSILSLLPFLVMVEFLPAARPAAVFVVPLVVLWWAGYSVHTHVGLRRRYPCSAYAEDLKAGLAEVVRFRTKDAARVEEFEDEGAAYFVRLDDDRVLFVRGQYLYEPEEEKKFPCTEFELVRGPKSHTVLDLVCAGSYLPPSKTLGPFTKEHYRRDLIPADGDIVPSEWEGVPGTYDLMLRSRKGG